MLLTKKFLHWNYFTYRQQSIKKILGSCLAYVYTAIKIHLLIKFLYFLKISILFQFFPKSKYNLNIKVPSIKQIRKLNTFFFNYLNYFSVKGLNKKLQIEYEKKKIKTILRAPFIFKNSQEQLFISNAISSFSLKFGSNPLINFFFTNILFNIVLKKLYFSKVIISKWFYF